MPVLQGICACHGAMVTMWQGVCVCRGPVVAVLWDVCVYHGAWAVCSVAVVTVSWGVRVEVGLTSTVPKQALLVDGKVATGFGWQVPFGQSMHPWAPCPLCARGPPTPCSVSNACGDSSVLRRGSWRPPSCPPQAVGSEPCAVPFCTFFPSDLAAVCSLQLWGLSPRGSHQLCRCPGASSPSKRFWKSLILAPSHGELLALFWEADWRGTDGLCWLDLAASGG